MQTSQNIYCLHLTKINDVSFTRREIDVISFLISGRSAKKIASFLTISPKTVEYHCSRIMQKISCNSRESIIDFVEKSPQYPYLKIYHTRLIAEGVFEEILKKLAEQSSLSRSVYVWISKPDLEEAALLKAHLKRAGFKFSTVNILNTKLFKEDVFQNKPGKLVHIERLTMPPPEGDPILFLERNFLSSDEINGILTQDHPPKVEFFDFEAYYSGLLSILKVYFTKSQMDSLFGDFIKNHLSSNNHSPYLLHHKKLVSSFKILNFNKNILSKTYFKYACLGLVVFLFAITAFYAPFLKGNSKAEGAYPRLRSELFLPPEEHLLSRKKLLRAINKSYQTPNKIQATLLLGIGGAGKTTLARQFARSQKAPVVWEINAETKDALIKSFEKLAHALCRSEADAKDLTAFENLKSADDREAKLFTFIQERLKYRPNWLLIYDNIETLSEIQKYIPCDGAVWGKGSVLLTSRDRNSQMNHQIHHTIEVGELNLSEKLSLFQTIAGKKTFGKLEKKNHLIKFLNEIPPFPLDISLAAKYLMTTAISYEEYIKNLSESEATFIDLQNNILLDSGSYNINRLQIIALSLDKLLKENKDFVDLFLLITLCHSQNIPRDLLTHHKGSVTVDHFIYHSKKYSLIFEDVALPLNKGAALSMHRTIQKISLAYLKRKIGPGEFNRLVSEISATLKSYTGQAIESENASTLIPLIPHCEAFLGHKAIPDATRSAISIGLGWIYGYFGDYGRAKQRLEQDLAQLKSSEPDNLRHIAKALAYLGNIYRELGDYQGAEKRLHESQKILTEHFPDCWSDIAWVSSYLGYTYRSLGGYEQAKELLEKSLQIYKTHIPNNRLGMARTLGFLGYVHQEMGNDTQAVAFLEESKKYYMTYFPDHHMDLADVLIGLGVTYKDLGQPEKSKSLLEESLRLYQKHLPFNHTNVAWVLGHLGGAYLELNEMSKAKEALEESLKIYDKDVAGNPDSITRIFIDLSAPILRNEFPVKRAGEIQRDTGSMSTYLGYNYRSLGDYVKAKNFLEESLQAYKMHFPQNHIGIARDLGFLGHVHKELGNYHKAIALLEQCKKYYIQYFPDNDIDLASVLVGLGTTYKELGQLNLAQSLLEEALRLYKKNLPSNHAHIARTYGYLGNVYIEITELEKAKDALEESLRIFKENGQTTPLRVGEILIDLSRLAILKNDFDAAEKHIFEALEIYKKNNRQESFVPFEILADLYQKKSELAYRQGNKKLAQEMKAKSQESFQRAFEVATHQLSKDSYHLARIKSALHKVSSQN